MIEASAAWSDEEGGVVYIMFDGGACPNGKMWQLDPLTVEEAIAFSVKIMRAAGQSLNWDRTDGEG